MIRTSTCVDVFFRSAQDSAKSRLGEERTLKTKHTDSKKGAQKPRSFQAVRTGLPALTALALLVLVWFAVTTGGLVPSYMLPSPQSVVQAFVNDFGTLMTHAAVTLQEAIYGLFIGITLAFVTATLMDRHPALYRALYPILIITQTIPTIAIAPLLVLWMGYGMAPKITLVVIYTFFPITVGLLDGYASADPDALRLLRSMGATNRQIFFHIKLPSSLGYFFAGLRVSVSYAMLGAVISEWLGGFEGLGVYMTRVKKAYSFDKMFAVILLIIIVSLLLMWLVSLLRRLAMPWERVEKEK